MAGVILKQFRKSPSAFLATMVFLLKRTAHRIWGALIFVVLQLLRPIVQVRLGHLFTSRIGHLAYNTDNYISYRRKQNSSEIALFRTDKTVSNRQLMAMWNRERGISIGSKWNAAYDFLLWKFPQSSMLISFKKEMHPEISDYSADSQHLHFTSREMAKGEFLLQRMNISRPFICMHNRDSAYLELKGLNDGNYHDFRDFDFDVYSDAIQTMLDKGYQVVRMGEIVQREFQMNDSRFHSCTGDKRSDFMDLFLIHECAFFVGGNTGFSHIARMFRKPALIVNYIPFKVADISSMPCQTVLLPKKIFAKSPNRILSLREMAGLNYDIHYKGNFFADKGLAILDNTEEEIMNAISEMESRLTGRWKDDNNQIYLQQALDMSLTDVTEWQTIKSLHINISSTFLSANPGLIN